MKAKSLMNRRNFLRGAGGAALALPWFESFAVTAAPTQRFVVFYVPIGVVRRSFFPLEQGRDIPVFRGAQLNGIESADITPGLHALPLTPTIKPLQGLRDQVTLITGTDRTFQSGTDVHAQCASCFLSSAAPHTVVTSAYPLDRTVDHIIADGVGRSTPFPTMEFSCNSHKDNKESVYFDNISWYGTGHVAPSIRDPRKAYRRMFGTQEIERVRNISDLVLDEARSLNKELGYTDREKFGEYMEAVRSIEVKADRLEKMKKELATVKMDEPAAAHLPRGEYIRLMADLMIVALQTGLTRVATFMVGPERWDTPYMFDGLFDKPMSHHKMSHNQKKYIEQLEQVDRFHVEQFKYLLERMTSIKEANGSTLLDNTIVTYGSGLGDGSTHQFHDLPIMVAGGGSVGIKGGRHLHCEDGTPLANLWLSQTRLMGLKRERYADSTGELKGLV
jgi:hypothetical protein